MHGPSSPSLAPPAHATPHVSVDVVLLTLEHGRLKVALIRRENAPFLGQLSLPGGYVHVEEDADLEATAMRVLAQKTGLRPRYIEQLQTFAGPQRDPRGWSVAVSHVALIPVQELQNHAVFQFHDVDQLPALAFDHAQQVQAAVTRVRNKAAYSTLPCWLLPERFTLTQLQRVYEDIFGERISRATFRSRLGIRASEGVAPTEQGAAATQDDPILIPTEEFQGGAQRPARLFKVDHLRLFSKAHWA